MKKMLTIKNKCPVYEKMDKGSKSGLELDKGLFIEYRRIKKNENSVWCQIVLENSKLKFIEIRNAFIWKKGIVTNNETFFIPNGKNQDSKIKLRRFSIIYFTNPILNSKSSFKVKIKSGVKGFVHHSARLEEFDWFIFKRFNLVLFIVTLIASLFFILVYVTTSRFGVLMSMLISGGIAAGVSITVMVLSFIVKLILYEIKIRL